MYNRIYIVSKDEVDHSGKLVPGGYSLEVIGAYGERNAAVASINKTLIDCKTRYTDYQAEKAKELRSECGKIIRQIAESEDKGLVKRLAERCNILAAEADDAEKKIIPNTFPHLNASGQLQSFVISDDEMGYTCTLTIKETITDTGSEVPDGAELILRERRRQVESEGYDSSHDDRHVNGEIARGAATYAMPEEYRDYPDAIIAAPRTWPFSMDSWKPSSNDRIKELIKAGAMLAAEIDRLKRLNNK